MSLQELHLRDEASTELRALVSHRRGLVEDQARFITRLRALLLEVFPGPGGGARPQDGSGAAGGHKGRLALRDQEARYLPSSPLASCSWYPQVRGSLAGKAVEAAKDRRRELPAAEAKAALISEMAAEVLRARGRIADLDARLEELVSERPEAEVVRSLPGMGPLLTAEFLAEVGDASRFGSADSLVAAARLVPVTRQSGNAGYRRRARRGNRVLKNLFYRSAFSCTVHHAPSRAYYLKKREEDKGHHRAMVALVRRRVNVLWTMLRDGETYWEMLQEAS